MSESIFMKVAKAFSNSEFTNIFFAVADVCAILTYPAAACSLRLSEHETENSDVKNANVISFIVIRCR